MIGLLNAVRINIDDRAVSLAAAIVFSAVFAALVMTAGVPALRQDWAWPASSIQVQRFLVDTWSGWSLNGIGAPAPYPSSYLLGVPVYVLLLLLGPKLALYAFLFAVGLSVTLGARALLNRCGAGPASIGILAFALFNSWVYTKVVAGHVVMVLAYGGTLFMIALLMDNRPRWKPLVAALAALFGQLQFFLIGMLLLLSRFRRASVRTAWLLGIVLFLPSLAGVAANWGTLSKTPYMLTWQQSQSVAPFDAAFLVGYFTGYTKGIESLARVSTGFAIAAALIGLIAAWRGSRREQLQASGLAVLGLAAFIAATGTKGPTAGFYSYVVQVLPISGLFRELFDLLGYLAVAYVALSLFGARYRIVTVFTALAGAAALLCWFIVPPSSFFVQRSSIPNVSFNAPENTRYALYPAFQPMLYQGRGLGLDPDAYIRSDNVTPLNTNVFEYPSSVALLQFQSAGRAKMLRTLSVSTVVQRAGLKSSYSSLRDQLGAVTASRRNAPAGSQPLTPLPELSLTAAPRIAGVADDLSATGVFFADARAARLGGWSRLPHFEPVQAANATIDAKYAWVDARLTFFTHPDAAQGFGGAATSSSSALLPVAGGDALLVYVRGSLRTTNGAPVASNTGSYVWTAPLPQGAGAVRCSGFCIVAGAADAAPQFPANPPASRYTPVHFHLLFPWLATGTLPPTAALQTVRYNVRYNRGWTAFAGGRRLQHVQLDRLFNGWILPASPGARPLVLIQEVAAVQTLFEILGTLLVLAVLGLAIFERTRRGPTHS